MVVARYHTADNKWHPDTRATHNLTNNANNIHLLNEDDNSQDHIQVANGAVLKIIHSGTSTFSYPSKSFMLKQILCVPEIQKNLLSVHHFCLNNNVFFEFHASFFLVKDCLGNIMHRGPLSNGLYNFSASLAHLHPKGLSSIHVSANIWHRHLSHASLPVINKAISLAHQNKNSYILSECQLAKSHAMPFKHVHVSVLKPLELIYSDV
jgi:hypothetical protein